MPFKTLMERFKRSAPSKRSHTLQYPKDLIAKHPYVNRVAIDQGRNVWFGPFFKDGKWQMFLPVGDELIEMHPVECDRSIYYSDDRASPEDIENTLISLCIQQLNFPESAKLMAAIIDDIFHLQTITRKLRHYETCAELTTRENASLVSTFVTTDLEYLFFVSRSYFDLIHRLTVSICRKLTNLKNMKMLVKNEIPGSFRKVLLLSDNKSARSSAELQEKWNIPKFIGDVYVSQGTFFPKLRYFRDDIGHREGSIGTIFGGDKFLINTQDKPFDAFRDAWIEADINENKLAPLDSFVRLIIDQATKFSEDIAAALIKNVAVFPEPTFPGKRVFLRGSYVGGALPNTVKNPQ